MRLLALGMLCLTIGCDAGFTLVENNCGAGQAPNDSGGCDDVGVSECIGDVAKDRRGGCEIDVQQHCDGDEIATPLSPDCADVSIAADYCKSNTYPEDVSGLPITETHYVHAIQGMADANGLSREEPHATIGAALAAAQPGARILVAKGEYGEQLIINKNVTVTGCGSDTVVSGSDDAAIRVGANNAYVSSLVIRMSGAQSVAGIVVEGATGVRLQNLVVREVDGPGVWLRERAKAELNHSLVEGTAGTAVRVTGSSLLVKDSALRAGSLRSGSHTSAIRVISPWNEPTYRAAVTVRAVLIDGYPGNGVFIDEGASATIEDTLIRSVGSSESTGAIHVEPAGSLRIARSVIEESEPNGIRAVDDYGFLSLAETTIDVANTVIAATKPGYRGCLGQAVYTRGANVSLQNVLLEDSYHAGAQVRGHQQEIAQSIIRDIKSADDSACHFTSGYGVLAQAGANLDIRQSRIEEAAASAIAVSDADLQLAMSVMECNEGDLSGYSGVPASSNVCGSCDRVWQRCEGSQFEDSPTEMVSYRMVLDHSQVELPAPISNAVVGRHGRSEDAPARSGSDGLAAIHGIPVGERFALRVKKYTHGPLLFMRESGEEDHKFFRGVTILTTALAQRWEASTGGFERRPNRGHLTVRVDDMGSPGLLYIHNVIVDLSPSTYDVCYKSEAGDAMGDCPAGPGDNGGIFHAHNLRPGLVTVVIGPDDLDCTSKDPNGKGWHNAWQVEGTANTFTALILERHMTEMRVFCQ